jgi:LacI family transcriptional regulator
MSRGRAIKNTISQKVKRVKDAVLTIAIVFGFDRRGCVGTMQGIGRYARGRGNWALVEVSPHRRLGEALASLNPAGIIVGAFGPGTVDCLRKIRRPVVTVSSDLPELNFPQVILDAASIGVVAANHLLECGLRSFGYFGPPWCGPDSEREGGFHQTLRHLSYTPSVCYVRPAGENPRGGTFEPQKHVLRWIRQLPKPAGVFAPLDTWALWLCGACKQEGIKVPEEIAIIGADNDELVCELTQPSISSVMFPSERIGYEAAAMLDRLINGKPVPDKPLLLPATSVATRQSTNVLAGVEPVVSMAVRFIREHFAEPIKVDDVLRQMHLPRRSFELKFREAIGRSPAQEIRRMRVALAKTILTNNSGIKTASIAKHCGFSSAARLFEAFRQATGMTPAKYRRTMGQEDTRINSPYSFAIYPAKKQ